MKQMGKQPERKPPERKPQAVPPTPKPASKPTPTPGPGAAGAAHKPEWVTKMQEEAVEKAKAAAEKSRVYEVKPGDNLSKIAKEVLGDAGRWKEIFEANKDQISDPNIIRVGQKLKIP